MNVNVSRFLAVSALALAVPFSALAASSDAKPQEPACPMMQGGDWGGSHHGYRGPDDRGDRDHGRDHGSNDARDMGRGAMGGMPGLPMMRGLNLSEAQRTQLQGMMEVQRKAVTEKMQAVHDARIALARLSFSDAYNTKKAGELAATLTQKESELAKLMAEQGNKVYQLLTPEQRTQVQTHMADREKRGDRWAAPAAPAAPASATK